MAITRIQAAAGTEKRSLVPDILIRFRVIPILTPGYPYPYPYPYPNPSYPTPYYDAYYTPPPPTYGAFSGCVYIDSNKNGSRDTGEVNFTGSFQVQILYHGRVLRYLPSYNRGCYTIANFPFGSYTVKLASVPNVLTPTYPPNGVYTCTLSNYYWNIVPNNGSISCLYFTDGSGALYSFAKNLDFGLAPPGSVAGCVFVDTNRDGIKNGSEQNYNGAINIQISPQVGTKTYTNGYYTIKGVPTGSYSVRQVTIPLGYRSTFPNVASTYAVNISDTAANCTISPDNGPPVRADGNVTELNFSITVSTPWKQATGLNIRDENGFTSDIPASSACSTYAIADSGGQSGILYSGNATNSLGQGTVSSKNWLVTGAASTYNSRD